MIIPFAVLYTLCEVAMLCGLVFMISDGLRSGPLSPHSVRYRFQQVAYFFMLWLTAVAAAVYMCGTAVPGEGFRIG